MNPACLATLCQTLLLRPWALETNTQERLRPLATPQSPLSSLSESLPISFYDTHLLLRKRNEPQAASDTEEAP